MAAGGTMRNSAMRVPSRFRISKLKSVKCVGLADFRDAPGFVQHQAGDGDGHVLRQAPAELAVEVVDRHVALADQAAVLALHDAALDGVVLVLDVAGDLLDDVLERDDAAQRAVLVDHDGEMLVPGAERLELVEQDRRFRE